jgi:preprotein translocase subunit SecY
MFSAFRNVFRIPDLKKRLIFTLGIIVVFRLGTTIPTPGVDGSALSEYLRTASGTLFGLIDLFSGGALKQMSVFALGIMPYISASIIMQLLTAVIPALEKLAKEGELGRKKINQYTRYATVGLSIVQSFGISVWLSNPESFQGTIIVPNPGLAFRLMTILTLTTGTIFIMWLGEQVTERGIGNGISLIIMAGIISRLPSAIGQVIYLIQNGTLKPIILILLLVMGVGVIAGIVALTQAQRKIPVQYAKRIIGRRIYGGQSSYIPLRVNQAGVIPIIFAQSIILFPATLARFAHLGFMQTLADYLSPGAWLHDLFYVILIVFFCYFYTAIIFNPVDMADNMKKYGGFIPGIRPGKPTAQYFDFVMTRITLPGALALGFIAILPNMINSGLRLPYLVASFFGGTGLIIIVGVALDTVKQIESQLLMRHYEGFMKKGKIKGRAK